MLVILLIIAQTVLTTVTMGIWWLSYPYFEVHVGKFRSSSFIVALILSFFLWVLIPIGILGWALGELRKKFFKVIP